MNSNLPINSFLKHDPTEKVPRFQLPRREWTSLNHIGTNQTKCAHNMHKWVLQETSSRSNYRPIIAECSFHAFPGNLADLHNVLLTAEAWLRNTKIKLWQELSYTCFVCMWPICNYCCFYTYVCVCVTLSSISILI